MAAAQNKRIKLTTDQVTTIKDMYNDIWRDLRARTEKSKVESLNERWLKDFRKQFRKAVQELNEELETQLIGAMEQSAGYAAEIQSKMFDMFNLDPSFSNMFTKIPKEVLAKLVNGDFYKDGKSLSKRIWYNKNKVNAEFDYIIQKGLTEKRSIKDIANDLTNYVNPNARNDMDFKRIYPAVGNRSIEYNSLRLAVTSISHAYQLGMQRSCKVNHFVEGIQWHIRNSHRTTCETCRNRDGHIYEVDKLPLDHPNGICYFTPVIARSLKDIDTELRNWINGEPNEKLDKWYMDNGDTIIKGAAEAGEENYVLFNKTHEGSAPVPKGTGSNGGRLQSHHGLQQQWAKENLSEYGYDPDLAPTVTIETGKGMPHTSISNAQNARRNARVASGNDKWGSSLQDELQYIVDDFTNAGFSKNTINQVLEQQYNMLDRLEVPYERVGIK